MQTLLITLVALSLAVTVIANRNKTFVTSKKRILNECFCDAIPKGVLSWKPEDFTDSWLYNFVLKHIERRFQREIYMI